MNLKICGLRHPDNIDAILPLKPDYLGFIFYNKSSRYAGRHLDPFYAKEIEGPKKVGVFVDETLMQMEDIIDTYRLDMVQLHGKESAELCEKMKANGVGVMKVFNVGEAFDFSILESYEPHVDFFLFDTKGKHPGGNGTTFDWKLMEGYPSQKPFFLSGGIGPEHAGMIKELTFPQLHALDINSKFEDRPGLKNIDKLKGFIDAIRS